VAAVLLAAGLGAAGAAQADVSWSSTATLAATLTGAMPLGPLDDATPLHVVVGLTMRDQAGALSLLKAQSTSGSPAFHQFVTPQQFTANYAATTESAVAVEQYLLSQGFTHVSLASNRLYVEATGTPSVIQKAFNTQLMRFKLNGLDVFANTLAAQVPASLAGTVSGVAGLQNAHPMHTFLGDKAAAAVKQSLVTAASLTLPPITLTPVGFQTAYDVGDVPEASNTVVAIFTEGDMTQDLLDIAQFRKEQGLVPVPISVVRVGAASTDISGDGEWDMDIAASTGLAGNVKQLLLYATASLNDADLIPDFNQFVVDNIATVGNASFGGCTVQEASTALQMYEAIFMASMMQGQTVFASSGDVGSSCPVVGEANGVPLAGLPDQSYPADSAYVIGVGGTTLTINDDGSYNTEISWDAGGGGIEPTIVAPTWQVPIQPAGALGFRGVPDVAMDADFLLSAGAYVLDGADTSNGGTSLASPLMTGCYARLQSRDNNKLGHAGPLLYATFATAGTPFSTTIAMHDITVGANGLFTALPGYDYNTGIGSCDIAAMAALLPTSSGGTKGPEPVAALDADTTAGAAPLTVNFDGSHSAGSTTSATITSYTFHFGDGTQAGPQAGATASHVYAAGSYDAILVVTDSTGASSSNYAAKTIVASAADASGGSGSSGGSGGGGGAALNPALLLVLGFGVLLRRQRRSV
jgi:pseudomonalisin